MTKREIANLCCRVLAVYVLAQALRDLPQVVYLAYPLFDSAYQSTLMVAYSMMHAAQPLVMLAAGAFLWRWSHVVAAWMTGHDLQDAPDERDASPTAATRSEIHAIAFSAVGLWVLADSVPLALGYAAQITLVGWSGGSEDIRDEWWTVALVEVMLRIAIGLYLLFGAAGLVSMLRRARNVGLEEREQPHYARSSADVTDEPER